MEAFVKSLWFYGNARIFICIFHLFLVHGELWRNVSWRSVFTVWRCKGFTFLLVLVQCIISNISTQYKDGFKGKTQQELNDLLSTAQTAFFITLVIVQFGNLLVRFIIFMSLLMQGYVWDTNYN